MPGSTRLWDCRRELRLHQCAEYSIPWPDALSSLLLHSAVDENQAAADDGLQLCSAGLWQLFCQVGIQTQLGLQQSWTWAGHGLSTVTWRGRHSISAWQHLVTLLPLRSAGLTRSSTGSCMSVCCCASAHNALAWPLLALHLSLAADLLSCVSCHRACQARIDEAKSEEIDLFHPK